MKKTNDALFKNVPDKDYCHLFNNGEPDGAKIVDFLKYKKYDIATATGIPVKSIRYDNKMPSELKQRFREWAIALNLVTEFFEGDAEKTALWFNMPNTLLGGMSPKDMIRVGRFKKLLKFIQSSLEDNTR